MSIQARAPVRIDFAGGWSDVPIFADNVGGSVVNVAITRYVTVNVQDGGGSIELTAAELDQRVVAATAEQLRYDGTLDLHKAAVKLCGADNIRIASSSSVPPGSGLGTSGALDVALIAALSELAGTRPNDRAALAELAFRLEAVELGLLGGRQDQYASAFGGFLCLHFHRDDVQIRKLEISPAFADELRDAMVLVYTGQTHFSSATHERVWSGYREGASGVSAALHGLKELAEEAKRALEAGNIPRLAQVVDENWARQKLLHPSIATPMTNSVETAARRAGAIGAKATGAGAGGCMIFIGASGTKPAIEAAVSQAGGTVLDYSFDMEGVRVSLK